MATRFGLRDPRPPLPDRILTEEDMPITRTITLDDPTPAELAQAFCDLHSDNQAAFLSAVWNIAKEWPGAGWCQQSYAIVEASDSPAREAIRTLASHLPADDLAYIAAAGADSAAIAKATGAGA